jgi:ABC-2 type transport system ATP-binding protein
MATAATLGTVIPIKATSLKLEIQSVSKQYGGKVWALRDFSLSLAPGVLGLLGPNGAGKTTLMSILATITAPTAGTALWNGADIRRQPDAIREVLGFLPQDFGVYPNLNAVEFLEYLAAIKGLDAAAARRRIDELLQLVNLTEVRKRPLGGFSGGMRQRVGIAQALLNDPKLLIVDEPTAGLDPEERVRFRNLLSELSGERIVILSTHIVSDVEAVATDIALIAQGQLIAHATPEALLAEVEGKVWECVVPSTELNAAKSRWMVSGTTRRSDGVHVRVIADSAPCPNAQALAPTLEDAYLLKITGSRLQGAQAHGGERSTQGGAESAQGGAK